MNASLRNASQRRASTTCNSELVTRRKHDHDAMPYALIWPAARTRSAHWKADRRRCRQWRGRRSRRMGATAVVPGRHNRVAKPSQRPPLAALPHTLFLPGRQATRLHEFRPAHQPQLALSRVVEVEQVNC